MFVVKITHELFRSINYGERDPMESTYQTLHYHVVFATLLTLYHTTECILPYKGGSKWVPSRLDRWHGEQGSAWKQCGSTSARACWRNRHDGPRVIVSTRSKWSRVSTLLSAHKNWVSRSKRLRIYCCFALTHRLPVKRSSSARRRKSRRWSVNWSSYNACDKHCSRWPHCAQDKDRPAPVPCLMRSISKSRAERARGVSNVNSVNTTPLSHFHS